VKIQCQAKRKIHPFGVRLEFLLQEKSESAQERRDDNCSSSRRYGGMKLMF
jgi:hypothetical protein